MADTTDTKRKELANAFGRTLDPLTEYAATFERMDIDPFELFISDVLEPEDPAPATRGAYDGLFDQWREYMADQGRHPACPAETHVKGFARHLGSERGNVPKTIKLKLNRLNRVYKYWQDDSAFPHPQDYNPIQLAKTKLNLKDGEKKIPPRISIEELRETLDGVKNVRDRAMIVLQLKLGLRATEVCNIKLEEVKLPDSPPEEHYTELGSVGALEDYQHHCVYVPSRYERTGNKSYCPRILPLDDELRRVLMQYLLIRPDADRPWLFLSQSNHSRIDDKTVNQAWKQAFHPDYVESETHRAVTSHFGRHRFTTYWKVDRDLNRELIKYMRGDKVGEGRRDAETMDSYVHTYYEDIHDIYLDEIYKLNV